MTYIADLDPENIARAEATAAYAEAAFGTDWETLATDPEDRRYVDYTDVKDPDEDVVAVPDFRLVLGAI